MIPMGASTNHANTKAKAGDAANDTLLDALREQSGEAPFAASSAALQAANSVMLASMRARMGLSAPKPSPVHASAAAQIHHSTTDAPAKPLEEATQAQPEPTTDTAIEPRAITAMESAISTPEPLLSAPVIISPASERRNAAAQESTTETVTTPLSFGARKTATPLQMEEKETTDSTTASTAALNEQPRIQAVDTHEYQEETDANYRNWQSSLPPAQRQWHRLAIVGVVVATAAINLFFFVGSGPSTPIASTPGVAPVQTVGIHTPAAATPVSGKDAAGPIIALPAPADIQAAAAAQTTQNVITPSRMPPAVAAMEESAEQTLAEPAKARINATLNPQELLRVISRP
jgi:hypothetical protein